MFRFGLVLMITVMTAAAWAQQNDNNESGEIYALAAVVGSAEIPREQGFAIGGVWKPSPKLGLVADFGTHFGSGGHAGFNLFMVGARFYSEEHYRLSGFVQVLTGVGHSGSWGYVLAPGAGVDIRVTKNLTLRPLQVDLLLPGPLRVASGIAVRFGR